MRRLVCGVTLSCALATAASAQAQSAKVAAQALFEDGRKLVAQGRFAEACPKFAESEKLDPSPSTLLNLASCYEKAGKTATAWETYNEAASTASAVNRKDYVAIAQKRAAALEPTLTKLTVTVGALVDGLVVKRDGVEVGRALFGVAIPIDPGAHVIEASAPKKKPWSTTLDAKDPSASLTVTVPPLDDAPDASPPPPPAVVAPPPPALAPPPNPPPAPAQPPPSGGSSQATIGIVVGAVGIVGVGLGTVFALSAKSKYNDSLPDCSPVSPNSCNQSGVDQRNSARTSGDIASVAFAVGGVALATGIVLWVTAPSSHGSEQGVAVGLVPTLGGGMLQGRW
jgi:serine/threonine-protein kinase